MNVLIEQLGGRSVLDPVVDEFYDRVLADDELAPIFAGVDLGRLVSMQREFLAAALTIGPDHGSDEIQDLHAGLGITHHHFSRFVELFLLTLEALGVDDDVVTNVGHHLDLSADDVVGEVAEVG